MKIPKKYFPILLVNAASLILFSIIFITSQNNEFLIYIAVIIFFLFLILKSSQTIYYPNIVLWGMTIWSIMHMTGGGIVYNGKKVYELMLIDLIGQPYSIFKFDQFVHIFGFGVATLMLYYLLKPNIKKPIRWISISIIIIMAGLGAGALNEIIEFSTVLMFKDTGVGGYHNNLIDLVCNLIGSLIALFIIWSLDKKPRRT
ncbi:MAG: DUF2238 domain-containing protein [Candidatus Moranbacteria bacterium]|nr:DUF2238 domain-containing protein [Candidatus Moranbacteria bacterium]